MPVTDAHRTIDAVRKPESARIIAGLTRMVHDVGLAEELAQDALVSALEQWPGSGVPDNPGAWLTAIAKRRAIDHIRRSQRLEREHEQLAHELEQQQDPEQDDVLRLMFISCHPLLPTGSRVALTLRLPGGLTAEEIARAFLVNKPRIAQRIAGAEGRHDEGVAGGEDGVAIWWGPRRIQGRASRPVGLATRACRRHARGDE